MVPPLNIVRRAFPDRPAFGTAVSRAVLIRVAAGELPPPTFRVHCPGRVLAFSRRHRASTTLALAARLEPEHRLDS